MHLFTQASERLIDHSQPQERAVQADMPSADILCVLACTTTLCDTLMGSQPVCWSHFETSCWPAGAGSSRFSGLTPVRICYVMMVYNSCMGHLLRRLKLSTSHPEAFLSINELVVRSGPPLSINELVVRSSPPL